LQLDVLGVDGDHARAELDANGQVMHRLEALVRELQQEARLAHALGGRRGQTHEGENDPRGWFQL
jgi:hypothetical protein